MTTWLHERRFQAVRAVLVAERVRLVADLGCGEGELTLRLAAEPTVERVVAIEPVPARLQALRNELGRLPASVAAKVAPVLGSALRPQPLLATVEAVLLVEVLEHLEPDRLSVLERLAFGSVRLVVVTTPNHDYNPLLGVPPTRLRHPEHRFEWGRARFARWAAGVGARHGYDVARHDVGACHPVLGGPTQMAVFRHRWSPPALSAPAASGIVGR